MNYASINEHHAITTARMSSETDIELHNDVVCCVVMTERDTITL